ncbi:hypothetical protein B5S28_g1518 [[Candida] boidinii]|nr:hypothetical protein B5S28_g1518 [[Candida] boidinii]OWB60082.1 hypothetical protein B5S29_g949 [[Candida] boidinii]OWB72014.1 hypothetical protein B5S31_g1715 [[Candida] boidinii]OWB76650.1 hypothetical protein B5S32_g804 [[Candida] boidinii]GME87725.1 unnamed protein product [[Candida] boidinii]
MSTSNTYDAISTSNATDKVRNTKYVFDNTPLPKEIPHVKEIGATTAPLMSAAFFIGERCRGYNDDFMLCQKEANGNGPVDCLKEGRRVTRCAASVLKDLNANCAEEFKLHYQCLNYGNMEYKNCRKAEGLLNKCVFDKLKLIKKIPDVQEDKQVFLPGNQVFQPIHPHPDSDKAHALAKSEGKI